MRLNVKYKTRRALVLIAIAFATSSGVALGQSCKIPEGYLQFCPSGEIPSVKSLGDLTVRMREVRGGVRSDRSAVIDIKAPNFRVEGEVLQDKAIREYKICGSTISISFVYDTCHKLNIGSF
ncbi:MAG: hypothetical protein K8T91_24140 [Planctomycetes bacterium]|nr:hypothetical protein [Planctomycetota bacterium]